VNAGLLSSNPTKDVSPEGLNVILDPALRSGSKTGTSQSFPIQVTRKRQPVKKRGQDNIKRLVKLSDGISLPNIQVSNIDIVALERIEELTQAQKPTGTTQRYQSRNRGE
jgi:hypothetical protein